MDPRDLSDHGVYRPGGGPEEIARERGGSPDDYVKLSSNENALGPSPKAVEAMRTTAARANVYPTTAHTDLTEALARRWDLPPEQVWLGPGANGALDYLYRAVLDPGEEILTPDPGYPYYPKGAHYHNGTVGGRYALRKDDDWAQTADRVLDAYDGERFVFVTTPHNPTGSEMPMAEIRTLRERLDDDTLLVVDEAYGEFTDAPSARSLLDDRDDVAVLRTFSKVYGLAGIRVGYALVPGVWADAYDHVNSPFAVSELACRAGLAALDDDEHVRESVELVRWSRAYMHDELDARTWESASNFLLAEVGDSAAIARACEERGVIVRDCADPPWNADGCIRITCGTPESTRRAVETINDVLAE
ncbi:MAG: histidinol-phosphate transaminase [Haloarculaceae archaeon]